MKRILYCLVLLWAGLCTSLYLAHSAKGAPEAQPVASATKAVASATNYGISGPYVSGKLSVFLIHGQDQIKGQDYLTLEEALAKNQVVVHETGDVNQLAIDNLSPCVVFLQSGDIVKGGRQDRAIQSDLLIPPQARNFALPAFCVEHGRWQQRGSEAAGRFQFSPNALASKSLKIAAKVDQNQSKVWEEVAANQEKLKQAANADLSALPSPTSYELTLENKNVQGATNSIVTDLGKVIEGKPDVLGYAFAINGTVNSADVYASNALFRKLWPKLLRASAVEAISANDKKNNKIATERDVRECLRAGEAAPAAPAYYHSTNETEVRSSEGKDNFFFATSDKKNAVVVHKNYLMK